jgi:F-type H+-transporting ATPase subunit b
MTSGWRTRLRLISLLACAGLIACSLWPLAAVRAQGGVSAAPNSGTVAAHPPGNRSADSARESRQAAGGGEEAEFKHSASVQLLARLTGLSPDHAYWLSTIINFVVIAALMVWIARKNLPAIFRNRTASIQKAIEEARRASEDANRRLSDIETRLARLDIEISEMRASAEREAAAEEERMKAAAAEDARKIVQSAEQEIAAAAKIARRELTAYVANLAVSLASRQIKVDPGTDQALIRTFAQELSASRNGGPETDTDKDGR